jgi:hypothetical protein
MHIRLACCVLTSYPQLWLILQLHVHCQAVQLNALQNAVVRKHALRSLLSKRYLLAW